MSIILSLFVLSSQYFYLISYLMLCVWDGTHTFGRLHSRDPTASLRFEGLTPDFFPLPTPLTSLLFFPATHGHCSLFFLFPHQNLIPRFVNSSHLRKPLLFCRTIHLLEPKTCPPVSQDQYTLTLSLQPANFIPFILHHGFINFTFFSSKCRRVRLPFSHTLKWYGCSTPHRLSANSLTKACCRHQCAPISTYLHQSHGGA